MKPLNIFQRALNRLGHRHGISVFPRTGAAFPRTADQTAAQVFDGIHEANHWGSSESLSGPGSDVERASAYVEQMLALMKRRGFTSLFDAPCGDLNWMSGAIDRGGFRYQGGDISRHAVAAARCRRPDLTIDLFDIRTDPFPDADVWQCRDCFLHLSFDDIWQALENFSRSNIRYALISTFTARYLRNIDIETGSSRYLDLQRPPLGFRKPEVSIGDRAYPSAFPRFVGLWPREEIVRVVAERRQ